MADETNSESAIPTLEDWQHWTLVMGRAQQMLMEFWAESLKKDQPFPAWSPRAFGFGQTPAAASDPMALMSPPNFALTNPQVLTQTIETRGENLLKGLANMLRDIASGQLTQTKAGAFEVGRNLATTPGKVVRQTPLYQLIQYTPTTDEVLKTPVVIFPPWINRFYILDLTPEKSFVKWCVDQRISLFMVSWKSADESIADARLDDYVLGGQIDAIDSIRDLLGVEAVHAIGYCVAGTTLAASLGYLHAHKQRSEERR